MRFLFTLILSLGLQFSFASDSIYFKGTVSNFNRLQSSLWDLLPTEHIELQKDTNIVVDICIYQTKAVLFLRKDSLILAIDTLVGKLFKHSFKMPSIHKLSGIPGLLWSLNSSTNKLIFCEQSIVCKGARQGITYFVIVPMMAAGPSWDERFKNSNK